MRKLFVYAVIPAIALHIISGAAAYAQESYAALLGKVSDQTGAAIPGAKITVISDETALSRTVTTDSKGDYRVALLSAGRYSLKVESSGFKTGEQPDLV